MSTDILWPIAKDGNGEYVAIADATRGNHYSCPECDSPMVARLGEIKRYHFAHYSGTATSCGESSYHAMAKHLLAFHLKQKGGIQYYGECPRCGHKVLTSKKIQDVKVEKGVDGYKPDLLIQLTDGIAYGEIVYKHRMEEKFNNYRDKHSDLITWFINGQVEKVPNMKLWSWKAIASEAVLQQNGYDLIYVSDFLPAPHNCDYYYRLKVERERKAKEQGANVKQTILGKMTKRMPRQKLNPWQEGRYEETLYANTRRRLWGIGYQLLCHGFTQSKRKPYIFYLKVPYGTVFVDLGGSDVVRPWEECGLIYAMLSCKRVENKRFIIDTVMQQLARANIETRLSWYDTYEPDGLYFGVGSQEG